MRAALRKFARRSARTKARTGRDSKFEHALLRALERKLTRRVHIREQYPVPHGSHPYRIDAVIEHPAGFRFALECDGPTHYDPFPGLRLREPCEQFARDRFVEDFCLAEGMSLFRIPYTYARKPAKAIAYCVLAAMRDFRAGQVRIHYLDYMATYAKINGYARACEGVERLHTAPDETIPSVHVRSR